MSVWVVNARSRQDLQLLRLINRADHQHIVDAELFEAR